MTHDYKRNGATTLFAALNLPDGTVIGAFMPRHRFQLHFTPTSASWLNMVEQFFAEITAKTPPPRRVQERRRARGCNH